VVAVAPDQAAIEAFGVNVLDDALWGPAFEAGVAQAPALAGQVAAVWNA
jgi:NTE family protein